MNNIAHSAGPGTPGLDLSEQPSLDRLLGCMDELANNSERLYAKPLGILPGSAQTHPLARYVFLGPDGGGNTIRIGVFAGIHGDEPEGSYAVAHIAALLEAHPHLAQGYALFFYPVSNPSGFVDRTRNSRSGKDLNREFWRQSEEPEVRLIESEILANGFDGIITLHGDDTSDGVYGFVGGSVLSENLLEPALSAAEKFLPRNQKSVIDGFKAHGGIINDGYPGMLKSVPRTPRPPFEITFETPENEPSHLQVQAFVAAFMSILAEYRRLISIGQNI